MKCSDELEARCAPFMHSLSSCPAHGTEFPEFYTERYPEVVPESHDEVVNRHLSLVAAGIIAAGVALVFILMVCAFI